MTPVVPVVPMLRAPGRTGTGNTDHQVRADNTPVCGARIDDDTWTVITAAQARHRCAKCDQETT